jgi:hypothetical protein
MLAATVQFGRARRGVAAAEDRLVDFLACLRRNGQIGTGWTLSRFAGGWAAAVGAWRRR